MRSNAFLLLECCLYKCFAKCITHKLKFEDLNLYWRKFESQCRARRNPRSLVWNKSIHPPKPHLHCRKILVRLGWKKYAYQKKGSARIDFVVLTTLPHPCWTKLSPVVGPCREVVRTRIKLVRKLMGGLESVLFLVQSALLGWFRGLALLKHYGNKALKQSGVNFNVWIIN